MPTATSRPTNWRHDSHSTPQSPAHGESRPHDQPRTDRPCDRAALREFETALNRAARTEQLDKLAELVITAGSRGANVQRQLDRLSATDLRTVCGHAVAALHLARRYLAKHAPDADLDVLIQVALKP